MTKGFVTQENSPVRKRFPLSSLDCRFQLAWVRRNCWLPVLGASMEQLPCASQEPTNNSPCTFYGFQPVCLGTGVTETDI